MFGNLSNVILQPMCTYVYGQTGIYENCHQGQHKICYHPPCPRKKPEYNKKKTRILLNNVVRGICTSQPSLKYGPVYGIHCVELVVQKRKCSLNIVIYYRST